MFSRRRFLLGSIASLASFGEFSSEAFARAAKTKINRGAAVAKGPHILARQDWAPAISADFVGTGEGGCCVIADQFGRLAIVDFIKPGDAAGAANVLAELDGLGKKILDVAVYGKRALVLASNPVHDSNEQQFSLSVVSLNPATAPSVVASLTLEKFSEAISVTAAQDLACVYGLTSSGDNVIATYTIGRGKTARVSPAGLLTLDSTLDDINLQDKVLLGLHGIEGPKLSVISLTNPAAPQVRRTLNLNGNYSALGRFRDLALLAGQSEGSNSIRLTLVSLRQKPEILKECELPGACAVSDIVGQKDAFLVLGENAEGRALFSVAVNKSEIAQPRVISLGGAKTPGEVKPKVAADAKLAYVGAGWSGVQAIRYSINDLSLASSYKIPRLPASGLASWGNLVVLASADLKLFDISEPESPSLKKAVVLPTVIKAITGAGSFVLCLSKDDVQLRKFDALDSVIASYQVSGRQLCFDSVQQVAYVIRDEKKKTIAQQVKAYSNAIIPANSFEIGANYTRAFAYAGYLLAGSINDVSLYSVGDKLGLIGSRHFDNFAIRDFTMDDSYIYATAVDQKSMGFFLVLSRDKGELKLVGSIDLPHDGVAIATAKNVVATVGRTADGKDLLSIINVSFPATPKITASLPALESASSIALKQDVAIVGGRGLEIASLS